MERFEFEAWRDMVTWETSGVGVRVEFGEIREARLALTIFILTFSHFSSFSYIIFFRVLATESKGVGLWEVIHSHEFQRCR